MALGVGPFIVLAAIMVAVPVGAVLLSDGDATAEDGPVEALSAVFFMAAAAVGALRVARSGRDGGIALPIISSVALLAALDELSFGERHLGWEPHVVADVPIDGAHDFLTVAWRLTQWSPIWAKVVILVAAIVGTVAMAALAWRFRGRILVAWSRADQPMIAMAAAAAVAVAVAQLIDMAPFLTFGGYADALEESFELAAALLTLTATTGLAGRLCGLATAR